MKATISTVTTAQFIRAIMREVRRRRQGRSFLHRRGWLSLDDLTDISGHNRSSLSAWERGKSSFPSRNVPPPTLFQALNCLEAASR